MSPQIHYPGNDGDAPMCKPMCRFPKCENPVFFDRRVDEYREWCSDEHMMWGIERFVERPCMNCYVWPRRNGQKFCSGDVCKYPRFLLPLYKYK